MAKLRKRADQPSLFENIIHDGNDDSQAADRSSTFLDNLALPIHRWYRYSAGFSADWIKFVLDRAKKDGRTRVLDPFVGSGTVVLEAEAAQVEGIGAEAHPFVCRIAQTKLMWRTDPKTFAQHANDILEQAKRNGTHERVFPSLLTKCFVLETLTQLEALRRAWKDQDDGSPASQLTWLVLLSILRECSPVGTVQWQYVLPKKTKAKSLDPIDAFRAKVMRFATDMTIRQRSQHGPQGRVVEDDARRLSSVPNNWADLVVTSPPYANNYDYADATRLEMTFFGELESWGCLQEQVRRHLVRACTQHVAPLIKQTDSLIAAPILQPIAAELRSTCEKLAEVRHQYGGKKQYHTMVAAYFLDMAQVWLALRRVTTTGGQACFVVGDSAPYGIYVPVDRWLGQLAVAAGFKSFRFEKIRGRNVKWKNRKHRVPLHEGRLWVEG
jgi:DNA modification methylase